MERTENYYIRVLEARERRTAEIRKNTLIAAACGIFFVIAFLFIIFGLKADASSEETMTGFKYYDSVMIGYGEDLETVAARYMDEEHYDSMSDYLDEVCSINHIARVGEITADVCPGNYIIVPYYSDIFYE